MFVLVETAIKPFPEEQTFSGIFAFARGFPMSKRFDFERNGVTCSCFAFLIIEGDIESHLPRSGNVIAWVVNNWLKGNQSRCYFDK